MRETNTAVYRAAVQNARYEPLHPTPADPLLGGDWGTV